LQADAYSEELCLTLSCHALAAYRPDNPQWRWIAPQHLAFILALKTQQLVFSLTIVSFPLQVLLDRYFVDKSLSTLLRLQISENPYAWY
jgi:hypothetical protein